MRIGPYTFQEFKERAAAFHGYPAPGLLIGGYMVSMAMRPLPEGTLFEAVVETKKCLPDAVQMLTLCSAGNNWMKVINLGKYAVSLFDKFTGEGFRVSVDVAKLGPYPEIRGWFLKLKPKAEQDTERLFAEIERAGETICTITPIRIRSALLGHAHMGTIGICPHCGEAFPQEDGVLCRGCQGEAPYSLGVDPAGQGQTPLVVPVEEAVGKKALHDMTQIIPGESKGVAFAAGQELSIGDVCRLQQMGRFHVAVQGENTPDGVHENEGAESFAKRMAGEGVQFSLPPKEGKISFTASHEGLLCLNAKMLHAFNMLGDVMCATRQDATVVQQGSEFAGTRVIPLYIAAEQFATALRVLKAPLFSVAPLRPAKVGILVTGTEVFKGLVQDKFIPIISRKVETYGCTVVKATIAPDDKGHIAAEIEAIRAAGADLLVTTGGLSVDPEDLTRHALVAAGMQDVLYGMPVLPGAMSLVGRIPAPGNALAEPVRAQHQALPLWQPAAGEMQVIGVPACALYFKITMFDVLLPRMLAGRMPTRAEIAGFGEGGFCSNCQTCTWPKCFFVR
ncbi:FmdE family protein [Desulfovibrio cuneatus]|uniref:FmdE family protein n=1 Tax=Desulfovibrio cuneatus TaxID=159728 RepID=UPI0004167A80|nr:FmdE family protein [Desulfovibrio cuneatus]